MDQTVKQGSFLKITGSSGVIVGGASGGTSPP